MFTNEQAQKVAESIYQSWKYQDSTLEPNNWLMVKMDQDIQDLCHQRLNEEQYKPMKKYFLAKLKAFIYGES